MFIEQGITPENKFWKYIVGSVLIIVAAIVGQLPLTVAILLKVGINIPSDTGAIMRLFDSNLMLFLIMLSYVAVAGSIYFVVKFLHRQSIMEVTTSRKRFDWNRFFYSFSIWTFFTIVSTIIVYYLSPESFVLNFKPIPFLVLVAIGAVMIPIQTSCEEYIFRGYLMQGFANLTLNKWFPLLMTSVIFGLLHIYNPEVDKLGNIILVYYIGTGLLLGITTLMDEGMELSLGFHAANNLVGALLVTADWSALQTNSIFKDISEPSAGIDVILPIVIVYPVLLFIFSKKYKWNNWKERLTGNIPKELHTTPIEITKNHE